MRKNPKVGGGIGGTCQVTKNPTQHSPRVERHSTDSADRRGLGYSKGPALKKQKPPATTREEYLEFSVLTPRDKGYVTYGDNNKGRILGVGRIGKPPSTTIEGVLYVEGLKHNLLSISQLCD
ncbi:hypothetical protein Lal_00008487 [Lupinus albus]|nr:hypothetical protein Lal_00008487 [Lupinus albus]